MITRKKHWFLAAAVATLLLAAVLFWPRTVSDYGAGAEGSILDSRGVPIADADVTVHFEETVFDAITPVRVARLKSEADGSFRDHYISCGRPGGRYRVVVKKDGYWPAVIPGSGIGHHRVVLRERGAV